MHHYEVAAKVLTESRGAEISRQFVGIGTEEFAIIETLPRETVSLKRSDYPVPVKDIHGIIRMMIRAEFGGPEILTGRKMTGKMNFYLEKEIKIMYFFGNMKDAPKKDLI